MADEKFSYSYWAKQQAEVKKIRERDTAPSETEDKMSQLRRLDASASKPGMIAGWTLGIIGALLLGVGMSCTMVWSDKWFVPGIAIGVAGIIAVALAPVVYRRMTKKRREKLAPEIMKLSDELLQK